MALELPNNVRAASEIRRNDFAQFLGIELKRQRRRIHQIAKHHGEVPTFEP
jgi:hypothetical protein